MQNKIPVLYVGEQVGATDDVFLYLVDEPSGSTVTFKPEKHVIVGVTATALARGFSVPDALLTKGEVNEKVAG